MAQPIREPLTDEELLAVAKSKDPQLTGKLNSEERRRLTRLSSMAPAGSGTLRATPGITSEMPSRLEQVNTMLAPMAHPQTLGDFASLLLPDAAAGISAATKAVRAGVGTGAELAGRGMEALGKSRLGRAAEFAGGSEAMWRMDPKGLAVAIAPTALKVGGRAMQRVGQAIRPAVTPVERVAAETPLELTRRLKAE